MAEEKNGNGKKGEGDPHGGTPEFNNFQRLLKRVLSVPKEELDKRRVEYEQNKERKNKLGKRKSAKSSITSSEIVFI